MSFVLHRTSRQSEFRDANKAFPEGATDLLNVDKELATRKLKLVPFEFKKAAKLTAAAQAALRLVDLGGEVGTRFPDELEAEQTEAFKALLQALKTEFGI